MEEQEIKIKLDNVDNNKWYIMLENNFYDTPVIEYIRNSENGYEKLYIYQRLLCLGTATEGLLLLCDDVPFTVESIASFIRVSESLVQETIEELKRFKLVEIIKQDDVEIIFMREVPKMQQSRKGNSNAVRQRRFTDKQKEEEAQKHAQDKVEEIQNNKSKVYS